MTYQEKFNHRINLRQELNDIMNSKVAGILSENIKAMHGVFINRNIYIV